MQQICVKCVSDWCFPVFSTCALARYAHSLGAKISLVWPEPAEMI